MDRTTQMVLARAAMVRAENLAADADLAAHTTEHWKAESMASAGSLWAEIARSHVVIAQALPESDLDDPTEETHA